MNGEQELNNCMDLGDNQSSALAGTFWCQAREYGSVKACVCLLLPATFPQLVEMTSKKPPFRSKLKSFNKPQVKKMLKRAVEVTAFYRPTDSYCQDNSL